MLVVSVYGVLYKVKWKLLIWFLLRMYYLFARNQSLSTGVRHLNPIYLFCISNPKGHMIKMQKTPFIRL